MAVTLKSFVQSLFENPNYVTLKSTDKITKINIDGSSETVFRGSIISHNSRESTLIFRRTYEGGVSIFFTSDGSVSFLRVDLAFFELFNDLGMNENSQNDRQYGVVIVNERPFTCVDVISKETGVIIRHQYDEKAEKFIALEFGNPKKYYNEARRFLETDRINTVWM
ncbi:hypothetical protein DS66_05005 [Mesotoga sp. SC_3PWM13N19]|nr:hypothetical protein DS66_05005 [Mesotoga sp. SC_3PWM13N19]